MSIYEKLSAIQSELNVPKDQRNSFGGYNYRSCEDILEKAKPICKKHGTVLMLWDELVNIGERYYVKATAHLYDTETTECLNAWAYAREEESKKGMDGSQITGASSSYARKYALNGLFCIDDVKDSDFTNTGDKPKTKDELVPEKKYEPSKKAEPAITSRYPKKEEPVIVDICVDCNKGVTKPVKDYSMKKYGYCLCMDCQKKYANK